MGSFKQDCFENRRDAGTPKNVLKDAKSDFDKITEVLTDQTLKHTFIGYETGKFQNYQINR